MEERHPMINMGKKLVHTRLGPMEKQLNMTATEEKLEFLSKELNIKNRF